MEEIFHKVVVNGFVVSSIVSISHGILPCQKDPIQSVLEFCLYWANFEGLTVLITFDFDLLRPRGDWTTQGIFPKIFWVTGRVQGNNNKDAGVYEFFENTKIAILVEPF